jgi:hypothetical protein
MCSIVNRTIEAMIAMNRRVWMDGPSANNSFIAEVSYQFKKRAAKGEVIALP